MSALIVRGDAPLLAEITGRNTDDNDEQPLLFSSREGLST